MHKNIKIIHIARHGEHTPVIPALGKQRQEDHEFKPNQDYVARPLPQKNNKNI
jgi:hypothetical protein